MRRFEPVSALLEFVMKQYNVSLEEHGWLVFIFFLLFFGFMVILNIALRLALIVGALFLCVYLLDLMNILEVDWSFLTGGNNG